MERKPIKIGTVFCDNERNITIINKKTEIGKNNKNIVYYKYHCNKCGNEDWTTKTSLKAGSNCNVCSSKKIKLGYNTIWDTDR